MLKRNLSLLLAISVVMGTTLTNITTVNAKEVSNKVISTSQKSNNPSDYVTISPNNYIGTIIDSYNTRQNLAYLGIYNFGDLFNMQFQIDYYTAFDQLDNNYRLEFYKNYNGSLVQTDSMNFYNKKITVGNHIFSTNLLKKSTYINQKYIYIKFGVSKSPGGNFIDYKTFKIVNPYYVKNSKPEIIAKDIELNVGDKFNPKDFVKVIDKEDGDLTSKVQVIENNVDTSREGVYKVSYKVTDSYGDSVIKTINVKVKYGLVETNFAPKISANDLELKLGDKFDPMKGVTAIDKEDGDLTSKIEVVKDTVDTSKEGNYEVIYKITDSQGASTTKTIKIIVKQGLIETNSAPKISANDLELKLGDKFDPMKGVTAIDKEDGDLTSKIEVVKDTVDTSKEGNYEAIYKITDSQGASTTKTIKVTVKQGLIETNSAPKISANDLELKLGDKFDLMKGVTAIDKEDGDLTSKIEVVKDTVDTSKEGNYEVIYKITDSQGASTTKTIKVTVKQGLIETNSAPKISANDLELKLGDKFDPMKGVTAIDKEDGDLTSKIEVIKDTVDTSKEGNYEVIYKITDSQGASTTKTIKVTVKQGLIETNSAPEIIANDLELKLGDKFDPMKGISAKDKEDGDLTSKIEVIENTVKTNKAGTYKVTYRVTDTNGSSVIKTIKVKVVNTENIIKNTAPKIIAKDLQLKIGDKFNPLKGIKATDKEDGDLTSQIKVVKNTVDTSKEGTYKVVYEVQDKNGLKTIKEIKVKVNKTNLPQTGMAGVGFLPIGIVTALAGVFITKKKK